MIFVLERFPFSNKNVYNRMQPKLHDKNLNNQQQMNECYLV